jgi:hypothetical protein
MDSFAAPWLTFGVLYCFFVVALDRRRILQCSVTKHSASAWVIQQLREPFVPRQNCVRLYFQSFPATTNRAIQPTLNR